MGVRDYESRIQTICLFIIAAFAVGAGLFFLKDVLIPLLLAGFLAVSLIPIIDWLVKRLNVNRYIAMGITFVLGTGLVIGFGVMLFATFKEISDNRTEYEAKLVVTKDRALESMPSLTYLGLEHSDPEWNSEPESDESSSEEGNSKPELANNPTGATQPAAGKDPATKAKGEAPTLFGLSIGDLLKTAAGALGELLGTGSMVLIFMMFLLLGKAVTEPDVQANALAEKPSVRAEILASIKQYVVTKTLLSIITGLLTGIILEVLGVPGGWIFGVLAFLLNYIPSIGSIVATLLPIPVLAWGLFVDGDMSWSIALLAIGLPGAIQVVIGNVVEPKMMGKSLDLHPIIVLLALIFFSVIWGPVGALIATPLTAAIKILFEKSPFTRPLADLLAGRSRQVYGEEEAEEAERRKAEADAERSPLVETPPVVDGQELKGESP